ncbi:MAG TPA: alpha/beta hydrolase [Candidatus Binataceae bacterium]|nr:alpha/beta hydrolase [Candidatus Binataceae bacterium]
MSEELSLKIVGIEPGPETVNAQYLTIHTTRGPIPIILHAAPQPGRAALCISGAIGGFDGPANLYVRLGEAMPARGIGVARINYRHPNDFGECVLDTLAGLSFLKGYRYPRVAILGHSFGGAVAINAGTLTPTATGVVALSSQLGGAHVVADLAPKPLLLIHGTADTILSHQSSEMLFERAGEPKTLKLFAGAGHSLKELGDEMTGLVIDWLVANI